MNRTLALGALAAAMLAPDGAAQDLATSTHEYTVEPPRSLSLQFDYDTDSLTAAAQLTWRFATLSLETSNTLELPEFTPPGGDYFEVAAPLHGDLLPGDLDLGGERALFLRFSLNW